MKFSEHFELGKKQAELDFVDVDPDQDTPLFVDPYAFSVRDDAWSEQCNNDIVSYFQTVIDEIRAGHEERARQILSHLSEPNETCLGLSRGRPSGRGIGTSQALDLYGALAESQAARTGSLSSLSDCELFVEGIGRDKISDITTNVIRGNLIRYTQDQCRLHGIELTGTVASGALWNTDAQAWTQDFVQLPVLGESKVVLVPKVSVRWSTDIDHRTFYNHFVLNFLQEEHLSAGTGLVRTLRSGLRRVYKKDLQQAYPLNKEFLFRFSQEHPEVLERYKTSIGKTHELTLAELEDDFDERAFAGVLIDALDLIPLGHDGATAFHRYMIGTLEFLFFPDLIYPIKENEIHEGRKRIDIVYTNNALGGFFFRRRAEQRVGANQIMVECKNYTHEMANNELDQISSRFNPSRGWFGLLIGRRFADRDLFVARCRDTAIDHRGYVVPLVDQDIVAMLRLIMDGQRRNVDRYVETIFRQLVT